jgi:hypothetical protein
LPTKTQKACKSLTYKPFFLPGVPLGLRRHTAHLQQTQRDSLHPRPAQGPFRLKLHAGQAFALCCTLAAVLAYRDERVFLQAVKAALIKFGASGK